MTKTLSIDEAGARFAEVLSAVEQGDAIVVERQGKPVLAIVPLAVEADLGALQESERRREALAELRAIRDRVRARNQDITTTEQAEAWADWIVREAVEGLQERGVLRLADERNRVPGRAAGESPA